MLEEREIKLWLKTTGENSRMSGEISESAKEKLASMTPREEMVLRLRYGIAERGPLSFGEIGILFSVTRERIRQIEAKAIRKLACKYESL